MAFDKPRGIYTDRTKPKDPKMLGAPRDRMRWEPLSKPKGCLQNLEEWATDRVRNLRGEVGLLTGACRRAVHGGDS